MCIVRTPETHWRLIPGPDQSASCPTFLLFLPPRFVQCNSRLTVLSLKLLDPPSRCRTAGCSSSQALEAEPAEATRHYSASISHTDIIPMFYLSPCNSFYILGLCSLAFVQSQPRDTGLYQAHMCALLQLTDISSIVTVTKLARLSWEMCWL